ncbi:MAG: hypothetical protein ACEPOZ_03525 [Marinifilaceae bacterium]
MDTSQNLPAKRPTFLTVLCILTFIWSGLKIIGNFINLIFSSFRNNFDLSFFDDILTDIDDEFAYQIVENAFEVLQRAIDHGFAIALSNLLLYGLNLTGAILMFQLNRKGFYLYVAAQVLLLAVTPVFVGWNFLSAFSVFWGGMFAVLFIVLYSLNLKHMR